jgi:hypothetical protein
MEGMNACNHDMKHKTRELYETPALERLGSFRELTQHGGILELLLGRNHPHDDCGMKSSSCHAVRHGR